MINKPFTQDWLARSVGCTALVLGLSLGQVASAATINLTVEASGTDTGLIGGVPTVTPVTGFRYLVEEDNTYKPTLNVPSLLKDSLSFEFHKSHHPIAVDGNGNGISGTTINPLDSSVSIEVPDNGRYFVSVVPYNGGAMGGGTVEVGTGAVDKTIRINSFPIPTAQISIRVFEDNNPVNGAIDLGERFLSHSYLKGERVPFGIKLFDPAGQYGAAGGRVAFDAYGNPLGTQYDAAGNITSLPTDDGVNGFVVTPDENGYLVIKNLPPAKYGVEITPPRGEDPNNPLWIQTSTIEGTRTIDAWVKPNNPEIFVEFGPPGPHVFVGFIRNFNCMGGQPGFLDEHDQRNPQTGILERVMDNACAGETATPGGATIHGQIVDNHMSRSPSFQFSNGTPFGGCRIAVNRGIAGKAIYSGPCGANSTFEISNLQPGPNGAPAPYSLSIWDDGLDAVISNHPFTVSGTGGTNDPFVVSAQFLAAGGQPSTAGLAASNITCTTTGCDLGQIPIFNWFHKLDTVVFYDRNQNGYRDCVSAAGNCDDPAVDDVNLHADSSATNLRFRDGRIYKAMPIDVNGEAPHEEVFPFFHWLVAEVDFASFKATGATFTVDNGGGGPGTNVGVDGYVPQPQTVPACSGTLVNGVDTADQGDGCTHDGGNSRTETGTVLTTAFQGFLGQKNTMEFGKANYGPGENGGISGVAVYAVTRAENDPRYAAAEQWEPGIPRVQVALFQDSLDVNGAAIAGGDTIIDDINGIAGIQIPDVDNYPLGWADGGTMGPEDVDNNTTENGLGGTGVFDNGDALEVVWSDSWDDNLPTNCGGSNGAGFEAIDTKCFDGLRNWNQVRPGVFDGGYAFSENLPSGMYIVKSFTPPGYIPLTEDSKNVDFGDEYAVPQTLPPICVGDDYIVPKYLSHVTDGSLTARTSVNPTGSIVVTGGEEFLSPVYTDANDPLVSRPLCDTKQVRVSEGKNAAADFHYFTEVPKAAHVVGGVINDVANEFNPNAPTFGEKFSPPWLPVAFYDFKGHEITRVYTDEFGKYNALLPSSNTVNISSPSGVAPNMVTACMNDSGLVDDGNGNMIIDPNHNPQFSQFCYTFQYMPGATTYLDTPVVSVAAFAGAGLQLDCDAADTTPMIKSVFSNEYPLVGAYVSNQNAVNPADRMLTINSVGLHSVPNPSATNIDPQTSKTITRDFGFGTFGSVALVAEDGTENPLTDVSWTDATITGAVPTLTANGSSLPNGRYQLVVTNGVSGLSSPMGVTVTVGPLPRQGEVIVVMPDNSTPGATPIQDALDYSANRTDGTGSLAGWGRDDLILVAPGAYDELPIMYQPVALQGAGAYSTTINARSLPAEKVVKWRQKVDSLLIAPTRFDLIPGQEVAELFVTEEGAGLTVLGKSFGPTQFLNDRPSRIDGFTITGASTGGGVFINGYVEGFSVSNNQIAGNQGTYGGGIRLGHNTIKEEFMLLPPDPNAGQNGWRHPDAKIRSVKVAHNMITRNGNFNGAGGGIAIYNGSSNYRVTDNLICGNFAMTDGAGIGHLGLSSGGQINDNTIIFNQSFRQTPGFETDGGGILIAGADPFVGGFARTTGSGHVQINRNLIQGNQAGAGDGAGIALRRVNGNDVATNPGNTRAWWSIGINANTIVNNVAGFGGGGISLLDAIAVDISGNTIANNESTATAGAAFNPGSPALSSPRVAGIVARDHNVLSGLVDAAALGRSAPLYGQSFSNPRVSNNIIWHNRSRIYDLTAPTGLVDPACGAPCYIDLSANIVGLSNVGPNLLSDATGTYTSRGLHINIDGDPAFLGAYTNGNPGVNPSQPEFQTIMVAPALDEGGNWLDVRYAPLSINDTDSLDNGIDVASDYHIPGTSIAVEAGTRARGQQQLDIDLQPRAGNYDLGSDEVQ